MPICYLAKNGETAVKKTPWMTNYTKCIWPLLENSRGELIPRSFTSVASHSNLASIVAVDFHVLCEIHRYFST